MESPLVSVVIPVYNREKYIAKALESACRQSYRNLEIIVVDNKSTDTTWEILKEWQEKDPRIRIYQNESNIGPVLNWGRCFELAKGKYVKILWSDDWMAPEFIEEALQLFDDRTAFVLSPVQIVNNSMEIVGCMSYQKKLYTQKEFLDEVLFLRSVSFPVSPGSALFRLDDLKNAFIIDIPNGEQLDTKKYGAGNDLLFFLIIAHKYPEIKVLPFFANYFRYHADSFSVRNNLEIYYEWARLFFIRKFKYNTYHLNWLKVYYLILIHIHGRADYENIYSTLRYTPEAIYLVPRYIIVKCVLKIKRFF